MRRTFVRMLLAAAVPAPAPGAPPDVCLAGDAFRLKKPRPHAGQSAR